MSSSKPPPAGSTKFRALDWAFDQRPGSSSAHFLLTVIARRANKPPHLCYMSHPRMGEETNQSLSTVGRGIGILKRGRYLEEVPSAPKLRRLGIRTYRVLVDRVETGHSDATDK